MAIKCYNIVNDQGLDSAKIAVVQVGDTVWFYAGISETEHSSILRKILTMNRIEEFKLKTLKDGYSVPEAEGEGYKVLGMGYIIFKPTKILLHGRSFIYGLPVEEIGRDVIDAFSASIRLPVFVS